MSRFAIWTILGLTLIYLIGPFFIIIGAALSDGKAWPFRPRACR